MSEENPYQPPSSTVISHRQETLHTIDTPNHCGWGLGIQWVKDGTSLFFKAPGYLFLVCLLYYTVIVGLGFIPILSFLSNFISPLVGAGFLYICMALDLQNERKIGNLFIGFKTKLVPLLMLSLIFFIGLILLLVTAGIVMAVFLGFEQVNELLSLPNTATIDPNIAIYGLLALLLVMLLLLPLLMALWFAPILILLNDLAPIAAMRASFQGCLRNVGALTTWTLGILVLAFIAALPLFLGLLILPALMFCSMYYSYKAIYTNNQNE